MTQGTWRFTQMERVIYGEPFARFMGCRHVMVDRHRLAVPTSGTAVRENPLENLAFLEPCVRAWFVRRVVLIGAESTGVFTYYDSTRIMNNSTDYSVGGFVESQISTNLHFRVAAGYQNIEFDQGGLIMDNNNASDYYANILTFPSNYSLFSVSD